MIRHVHMSEPEYRDLWALASLTLADLKALWDEYDGSNCAPAAIRVRRSTGRSICAAMGIIAPSDHHPFQCREFPDTLTSAPQEVPMLDFDTILAPLAGVCRRQDLQFSWRTYEKNSAFEAVVHAGRRDGSGAQPQWLGKGATREAALTQAAGSAAAYWGRPDQHGISTTLLDLVRTAHP